MPYLVFPIMGEPPHFLRRVYLVFPLVRLFCGSSMVPETGNGNTLFMRPAAVFG